MDAGAAGSAPDRFEQELEAIGEMIESMVIHEGEAAISLIMLLITAEHSLIHTYKIGVAAGICCAQGKEAEADRIRAHVVEVLAAQRRVNADRLRRVGEALQFDQDKIIRIAHNADVLLARMQSI